MELAPSGFYASYASRPEKSRGRLHPEMEDASRNPFQRDRDRLVHSTAFRRLEYKTQVFVNHEGDHFRTRLTHSLEVSQLARSISRALHLSEDLAETVALAHDLGHPPFGHAGEDGLKEAMQAFGGFDHNAQTIRLLTDLEKHYAEFDGLNLTWETLEGIAKHNGPVTGELPRALKFYADQHDLELKGYASAEAQVASLSDDIAYTNHDMDDGLRAGLFTFEQLRELPLLDELAGEVEGKYNGLDEARLRHETIRRLINRMVKDLVAQTEKNLNESKLKSVDDIRALGRPVAEFSGGMAAVHKAHKAFLFEHMYRHYKVNRMASKARRVVKDLFCFLHAEPECLPTRWRKEAEKGDAQARAVVVADFIAGMTDRFALDEHRRLFDVAAQ